MRARAHARTHTRTHARAHARTCARMHVRVHAFVKNVQTLQLNYLCKSFTQFNQASGFLVLALPAALTCCLQVPPFFARRWAIAASQQLQLRCTPLSWTALCLGLCLGERGCGRAARVHSHQKLHLSSTCRPPPHHPPSLVAVQVAVI